MFQVCYLNCIRILLKEGANPNCSYRANLTPLHVLVFTVSENITLNCDVQKELNFEFIKNLLILLLIHGLDPNVRISNRTQHILQSCMDMIQNVRDCKDIHYVYDLTLTLVSYFWQLATKEMSTAPPTVSIENREVSILIFNLHKQQSGVLFSYLRDSCKRCLMFLSSVRCCRVTWFVFPGTIRGESRPKLEHDGSNKKPSFAPAADLEDEELHPLLLHNADIAKRESHHGPEHELFEDHNVVLLDNATQAVVRVFENLAHSTAEFGAG